MTFFQLRACLARAARSVTAVAVLALLTVTGRTAQAQFLTVRSTGLYTDRSGTVFVIESHKAGAEGIMVLVGPPTSAQEFNLEQANLKDFTHCFFKYAPDLNGNVGFSELSLGNSVQKFAIAGNVTVNIAGRVSVGIANGSYLTISTEGPAVLGNRGAFLAFVGLEKVLDGDRNASAILAANQLDPASAELVKPYLVKEREQRLFLDVPGDPRPVSTRTIGVDLSSRTKQIACLKDGVTIISNSQLKALRSAKTDADRIKLFDQYSKAMRTNPPTKNLIYLRIAGASAIALDPIAQSVRELRELKTSAGKRKVCLLDDLGLS